MNEIIITPQADAETQRRSWLLRGAAAVGAGMLAVLASTGDSPRANRPEAVVPYEAIPDTADTALEIYSPAQAAYQPAERMDHNGENLLQFPAPEGIPSDIQESLRLNTVFFKELGCSGRITRDANGEPIEGVLSAHCGFSEKQLQRQEDAKGKYVTFDFPIFAYGNSDSYSQLTRIAEVSDVILPAVGDTSNEFVMVLFKGHSEEEHLAHTQFSKDLKPGDTAYYSGWSVEKVGDTTVQERRQEFPMLYLGMESSTKTKFEYDTERTVVRNLRVFAMKTDDNRPGCIPGSSGGGVIDTQEALVGSLSSFMELKPSPSVSAGQVNSRIADIQKRFNIDVTGYDLTCSFASISPVTEQYQVRITKG